MIPSQERTRIAVIMAGGAGERFWPLSRKLRPKQLLRLTDASQSMLAEAVTRLSLLIAPERVYIVTGRHLVEPIRDAEVGVPPQNVIAEPCKRNTSGALVYAAAHALATHGGDGSALTMAVTTADHLIGAPERFRDTLDTALDAAEQEDALVTLGVVPSRPETGYGYIQVARDSAPLPASRDGIPVYRVSAFHEKPNRERAEDFIAGGNYYWNSGMFFWTISAFLTQLDAARPELARAALDMAAAMRAGQTDRIESIFESVENISIDYALMEHARNVLVVRADFPWDDVGAWPALDRTYPHDEHGNVVVGKPILSDAENCIVYNEPGADAMAVSVIGVEDLVVVVTQDAVLVVPKERAQDVRHAVEELKRRNSPQV
ncbi:MAG: mannose-1-phosphate guanylyltransferase [Candidatus Hydrogenedentes bacterium]|nr:mannose-1-phosphate guanylyltransferase [Candidatus Hydrogenedentota bacterium]